MSTSLQRQNESSNFGSRSAFVSHHGGLLNRDNLASSRLTNGSTVSPVVGDPFLISLKPEFDCRTIKAVASAVS